MDLGCAVLGCYVLISFGLVALLVGLLSGLSSWVLRLVCGVGLCLLILVVFVCILVFVCWARVCLILRVWLVLVAYCGAVVSVAAGGC